MLELSEELQADVVSLRDVGCSESSRFGSKACRLAKAARAGFFVPAGFCISIEAFRRHIARCLPDLDGLVDQQDWEALRAGIEEGRLEERLALDLRGMCGSLFSEGTLVAVRSSGVAEDLVEFSYAGIYRSELNVPQPAGLPDAIRRCWAASFSDEAARYRNNAGGPDHDYGMGILVQAMYVPDYAGVAFTRDPVSGRADEVVVEAVRGLPEKLVDGSAKPATIRVSRSAVSAETASGDLLPRAAHAAARLAMDLEELEGRPQDVEWGWQANGEIALLQTRPITSPTPSAGVADSGQLLYEEPFSPFGAELAVRRFERWLEALSLFHHCRFEGVIENQNGLLIHDPRWRRGRGMRRLWTRLWSIVRFVDAAAIHRDYAGRVLPDALRRLEALEEAETGDDLGELIGCLDAAVNLYLELQVSSFAIGKVAGLEAEALERICRSWVSTTGEVTALDLLSGLENPITERDLALDKLRKQFQALGEGPGTEESEKFHRSLSAFENRYGYVWADRYPRDPAWELDLEAQSAALHVEGSDLASGHEAQRRYRLKAVETCRSALSRPRRLLFDYCLRQVERDYPHKEGRNEMVYRSVAAIRGVALDLGRRLAASGALGTSADVFMLEMDELRNLATGKTERGGFSGIIAERRALYRRLLAACRSGSSIESAAGRKQELAAESCSRGIGVGPARLVRGFGELSRIQPGDILVCKQFRPAWTSVFSRVAGVAVELGGTLSHGSILAREYGVPMVINVPQLCANVHDGDWITVDGSRGSISIESSASPERSESECSAQTAER